MPFSKSSKQVVILPVTPQLHVCNQYYIGDYHPAGITLFLAGVPSFQGGRIFEISWVPNFPVNNFAQNNGKNRVIFLAVNMKIIVFTGNIRNILNLYDKNVICLACHKKYISCAMKYSSYGTRCSLFFL